jgi:hypothetical protein
MSSARYQSGMRESRAITGFLDNPGMFLETEQDFW